MSSLGEVRELLAEAKDARQLYFGYLQKAFNLVINTDSSQSRDYIPKAREEYRREVIRKLALILENEEISASVDLIDNILTSATYADRLKKH